MNSSTTSSRENISRIIKSESKQNIDENSIRKENSIRRVRSKNEIKKVISKDDFEKMIDQELQHNPFYFF